MAPGNRGAACVPDADLKMRCARLERGRTGTADRVAHVVRNRHLREPPDADIELRTAVKLERDRHLGRSDERPRVTPRQPIRGCHHEEDHCQRDEKAREQRIIRQDRSGEGQPR
jgi:hypothetical protein